MGPLGWQETVFIFFLALLLFGPKKLPELGRTIGKAMTEFRRASSELKSTFDREMRTLEQETELKELKEAATSYQYDNSSYNYDYSSSNEGSNYESSNYDGAYGTESYDTNGSDPSTLSASAPEGAESTPVGTPEGTVAYGTETAVMNESEQYPTEPHNGSASGSHPEHTSPAEHNA